MFTRLMFARLLLLGLLSLLAASAWAASAPTDTPRIGVMTMQPGDIFWERFGHDAIVVDDPAFAEPISYNFGFFDLEEPDFAARFVPEKRQIDLIKAFAKGADPDFQLVLAGDAEFETPYSREGSVHVVVGDAQGTRV